MTSPMAEHMENLPSSPNHDPISTGTASGFHTMQTTSHTSICEIEEEIQEAEDNSRHLYEINNYTRMAPVKLDYDQKKKSQFSFQVGPNGETNVIYVAITKMHDQSMDALVWTLKNLIDSDTVVYLIHVFPELRYITTPLGKLPINQANPEQKETFMNQERIKRRDFLQTFLDLCSASKVGVETILIESDMEAKVILDLIPVLNIRKLVLGTSKSTLRKTMSKKGSGTVDQILHDVPESCDVKIICDGKEVMEEQLRIEPPTPSLSTNVGSPKVALVQDQINDTFSCCFKPKAVS